MPSLCSVTVRESCSKSYHNFCHLVTLMKTPLHPRHPQKHIRGMLSPPPPPPPSTVRLPHHPRPPQKLITDTLSTTPPQALWGCRSLLFPSCWWVQQILLWGPRPLGSPGWCSRHWGPASWLGDSEWTPCSAQTNTPSTTTNYTPVTVLVDICMCPGDYGVFKW